MIAKLHPIRTARCRGFSLTEVMLVTALMAIIVSLAVPGYRDLTLRANRTEAIATLLQSSSCQERMRATSGWYDTGDCLPEDGQHYAFRYEPADTATAVFRLSAEPLALQLKDICGVMILDQSGHREVGNENAETGRCWAGR